MTRLAGRWWGKASTRTLAMKTCARWRSEYIHRCHLRVNRFLKPAGIYLLDAGSGPIQYPDYLVYSQDYQLPGLPGYFDSWPWKKPANGLASAACSWWQMWPTCLSRPGVFDGVVSLHTLHHLPQGEQKNAYLDLYRVLAPGSSAVVVNGWTDSALMKRLHGW